MMRTWQTRLRAGIGAAATLDAYADLYGRVERSLFADLCAGRQSINELKREYLKRFEITARQFNAIRIGLQGKVSSIVERRPDLINELEQRINKATRIIAKLTHPDKIHQKNRRLANLSHRLGELKSDQENGVVRLCFGSKRLFRAQFTLEENGYADHAAWLEDWKDARSSEFLIVGSKDETAGNQSCQLVVDGDAMKLRLRLPNALGKFLVLPLDLSYGRDDILEALTLNQAMTYRFVRDAKGWRVFVSTNLTGRPRVSSRHAGSIALDINSDHLAVTDLDRYGNIVGVHRIPLCTYGKTRAQAMAIIGDAVKKVVVLARSLGKPIAIERLDFAKKKTGLEKETRRYARMLSGFAYSQILQTLHARAFDAGIEVAAVNPACTSIIGRHKFARRYGISNHQAAAAAIGRRAMDFSESPNRRMADQVAFALPVRNRAKHLWPFWRQVARKEAAHAARSRSVNRRSGSAGKPPEPGSTGDCRRNSGTRIVGNTVRLTS
jgi:IS605 OrfB family transposase